MKNIKKLIPLLLLFVFVYSAEAQIVVTSTTASSYGLPTVTTNEPRGITVNSAVLGGTITHNGGQAITEKGICWSNSKDGKEQKLIMNDDTESESFSSNCEGFFNNTSYYVRAFATNAAGTAYGKQLEFKTKKGIEKSIREKGLVIRPEIGIGIIVDDIFPVNALCNVSYQFNPYVSIGGGTGFYYIKDDRNFLSMPIYASIRTYFCNRKISPYFDLKLGYMVPIIRQDNFSYYNSNDYWTDIRFSGFYGNFNLGLQYKNYDFAIEMDLITQKREDHQYHYQGDELYPSIGLKFGYNFQIKKKK